MKHLIILSASLFSFALSFAQEQPHLCFNEIMQSNVNGYVSSHDFPDSWIELYNPADTTIRIQNYSIVTSAGDTFLIPKSTTIKSKSRLIIMCDKENSGLHTNFRLESTQEGALYLYDVQKNLVDSLVYPAMPAPNIAYGRIGDGAGEWGWEFTPTPGAKNKGGISSAILPNPVFSMKGQVMTKSAKLTISLPEDENLPADTRIYITTNGSEPTIKSQNDSIFTFDVDQTFVVRAKLISSSAISRPSQAQSFIFHPRETNIPIISILTDSSYLYSDDMGILSSYETNGQPNYKYDWRRPINIEYLGSKGDTAWFNQLGEVAVGGGATRAYPQRTMKVYANKRFGTKRYKGEFWPEKPEVTKVKSFMLRNGGNAFSQGRINDAFVQRLFGIHVPTLDYQAYSPSITYINGQYAGVYGLRERSEEDYVEANYGLEDIETATALSYSPLVAGIAERKTNSFGTVYNLYRSNSATYDKMAALIDVDNFMQALIAQMFVPNHDYPHNNVSMWRQLTPEGKWKWIIKDLDYYAINAETPYDFNMFKYLLGTPKSTDFEYEHYNKYSVKEATKIYKKMISFNAFKQKFIDTYSTYLGDFLKPSVSCDLAIKMRAEIQEELDCTLDLYEYGDELEESMYFFNEILEHAKRRPGIIYNQMASFFALGKVIPMTLKPKGYPVTINGIGLTEGNFDGAYFSNRTLRLNSGDDNHGWKMMTYLLNEDNEMVHNEEADTMFYDRIISIKLSNFENCDSVAFSTIAINATDFDNKIEYLDIDPSECQDWSSNPTISIEEPQYAYVNITEIDSLPSSKYNNIHAYLDFYDNAGNRFRKKIILNRQGSSEPKMNFSIQFCEDDWIGEETPLITFGDWVTQDEFHLKGFYEDGLRGTAEVAYQLYGNITDRSICYPHAFPVSLYVNGDFYGIMSWQIKKHRKNMGLTKDVATHVWLDGKLNDTQLFQDSINWTKFEVRNPKNLYYMDGTVYDGDYPDELIDTTSSAYTGKGKMARCAEAKKHIVELSHYCGELQALKDSGTNVEDMRAAIMERFDVPEIINYKVFSLITNNYDGFSQNWQWFTYDGKKWTVAPYDCNLTFGYNEDGTTLWPASQSSKKYDYHMEKTDSVGPMLWIKDYFWDDVKARYVELRENNIISTENMLGLVSDWYNRIDEVNYSEEWNRWPDDPCTTFDESPKRFKEWISERIALEDEYLGYVPDSMEYDLKITSAEWGTLCVPFSFDIPEGVELYTIRDIDADGITLALEPVEMPKANMPYLVHGLEGIYPINGEIVKVTEDQQDKLPNGLLVGTLVDGYVPAEAYALQKKQDKLNFYHVSVDNYIPIKAYRAYLVAPSSSKAGHFRFSDTTTFITEMDEEVKKPSVTYNYWGQRISNNKSGFCIERMPDGSFKKVIKR